MRNVQIRKTLWKSQYCEHMFECIRKSSRNYIYIYIYIYKSFCCWNSDWIYIFFNFILLLKMYYLNNDIFNRVKFENFPPVLFLYMSHESNGGYFNMTFLLWMRQSNLRVQWLIIRMKFHYVAFILYGIVHISYYNSFPHKFGGKT